MSVLRFSSFTESSLLPPLHLHPLRLPGSPIRVGFLRSFHLSLSFSPLKASFLLIGYRGGSVKLQSLNSLPPSPFLGKGLNAWVEKFPVSNQAHNGSGKTTCFVLGMLSRVDPKLIAPQALCICQTRELEIQNMEVLLKMGKYTGITSELALPTDNKKDYIPVSKRVPMTEQVIIGTPGTINKWIKAKKLGISQMKMLVFDEADHMLSESGFREDYVRAMKEMVKENPDCQNNGISRRGRKMLFFDLTYLLGYPGVAPGFWNMFVLAFVERLFRPTYKKIRDGRLQGVCQCLIREYRMVCDVMRGQVSKDFFEKTVLPRTLSALPTLVIIGGQTLHLNVTDTIEEHGVTPYPFTPDKFVELEKIEKAKQESQTLESVLVSGDIDYLLGYQFSLLPNNGRANLHCTNIAYWHLKMTCIYNNMFSYSYTNWHPKICKNK
ncbi:hypothetical protein L2E82_41602 [Cichorium intybus]|uniref:Uncharacterized protein n=1 Tax=Cichorium intybus TaxID=13427 RepID=A0ACB9ANG9_CICIN|nr:hypothetical protein L2E82_41602 [Cichorium intybus]